MREKNKIGNICVIVLFCMAIGIFFALELIVNAKETIHKLMHITPDTIGATVQEIDSAYNNHVPFNTYLLKLDSIRQLVMNSLGYEDGSGLIVRDSKDRLHSLSEEVTKEILNIEVKNVESLADYCKADGIPFLYVQAPFKADTYEKDLPYGLRDYSGENSDGMLNALESNRIDTLDLREQLIENDVFYKTDHHWQVKSAYQASTILAKSISAYDGLSDIYIEKYGDASNYKTSTYGNFLGSYGRRTGEVWSGIEDFTYIFPTFDTNFHFQHIKNGEVVVDKQGDFEKALISDPSESDYYCSYMNNSYVEMIIDNLNAENDKKILVISDSFGRTMCCYLSLYFRTLVNLDTQDGRFDGSIKEYINDYKPDAVVVMFNSGMYVYQEVFERLKY